VSSRSRFFRWFDEWEKGGDEGGVAVSLRKGGKEKRRELERNEHLSPFPCPILASYKQHRAVDLLLIMCSDTSSASRPQSTPMRSFQSSS